jgi:IS30 family transposase
MWQSGNGVSVLAGRLGEDNITHKLTNEDVREIKRLLAGGYKQREIARQFGIHQVMVSLIKRGKRWPHLTNESSE